MVDFVGVYTKVESYGDAKISFRIYRRQLSPDMSRRWFLSIGPGYGGTRTENDIDLYSAPASVDGPATCFVDEIPPRNKWEPMDGSGLEGTRGPCLLWIPKKVNATGGGDITQNIFSPMVQSNMRNGDDLAEGNREDSKCENELPPKQIVVHKKCASTVSSPQKGSNTSDRGAAGRALPSTSASTTKGEILRVKVDGADSQPSSVVPPVQNIFRAKDGNADGEPTPGGDKGILKQENTLSARNGSSSLPVALTGPPRVQNLPTDLHEVLMPPRIVKPSKSTDTTPTVASSTFDTAEADVRAIYVTDNHDQENREGQESLCLTKSSGSSSDSDAKKKLYNDIVDCNFADLLELPEDVDTVYERDSNTNSDETGTIAFSDLSEDDGIEVHEYNLLREWSRSIGKNREKHKVVKWTDQIEKDTAETYDGDNNRDQKVKTDDLDYQFYARTVGRQSLIAENIGAALRRFNGTCKQVDNRADAAMTATAEKTKCMAPGPCRCSACKQRVVKAYLELERREFYEI